MGGLGVSDSMFHLDVVCGRLRAWLSLMAMYTHLLNDVKQQPTENNNTRQRETGRKGKRGGERETERYGKEGGQ